MRMRLSYDYKDGGHIGMSRQSFGIKDGGSVKVVIDRQNFEFEIVNHKGEVLASGGETKNYIVLLRKVKRALANLGVDFTQEERNRDFGIVKK